MDDPPRTADFRPTHRVPAAGLDAYAQGSVEQPTARLDPHLDVMVLDQRPQGWARIRCSNGWEAWVDGRALVALGTVAAASGVTGGRPRWLIPVVLVAVLAVGATVAAVLLMGDDGDGEVTVGDTSESPGEDFLESPGEDEDPFSEPGEADPSESDTVEPDERAADEGAADEGVEALLGQILEPDFDGVGPLDEPATGADAIVGGAPDTTAARAMVSALEDGGVDTTGMGFYVLPVTGSPDWLLVIEVDDDTALSTSDSEASEQFVPIVMDNMESLGLTQLVFNYEGSDAAGPLVATFTMSLEDLQEAAATGKDMSEFVLMQVERQ